MSQPQQPPPPTLTPLGFLQSYGNGAYAGGVIITLDPNTPINSSIGVQMTSFAQLPPSILGSALLYQAAGGVWTPANPSVINWEYPPNPATNPMQPVMSGNPPVPVYPSTNFSVSSAPVGTRVFLLSIFFTALPPAAQYPGWFQAGVPGPLSPGQNTISISLSNLRSQPPGVINSPNASVIISVYLPGGGVKLPSVSRVKAVKP